MATLYITEFNAGGGRSNFSLSAAQQLPISEDIVPIGVTSAQSSILHSNTTLVRLHCDSTCSVVFGDNPTATTTDMRMAANQTEYFAVPPNSNFKIAVIANS